MKLSRKYNTKRQSASKQSTQPFPEDTYSPSNIFLNPNSIRRIRKLAEGNYACVELSEWSGHRVAVKKLKPNYLNSERDIKDFFNEAALLRKLDHPGIPKFVGVAIVFENKEISTPTTTTTLALEKDIPISSSKSSMDSLSFALEASTLSLKSTSLSVSSSGPGPLCQKGEKTRFKDVMLVQEYMNKGTLKSMIGRQMEYALRMVYSREQGLRWLIQIADALKYLHSARPSLIHRDLKLENVLLTMDSEGEIVAKIGDFGLHAVLENHKQNEEHGDSSKNNNNNMNTDLVSTRDSLLKDDPNPIRHSFYNLTGKTGSLVYMAPEVYNFLPYNEKADIFSFAIMIYEVFRKILLLSFICVRGVPEELEEYAYRVSQGHRPILPEDWPSELVSLLERCWAQHPPDRPSIDEVLEELHKLSDTDWICNEKAFQRCVCCAMQ